ncbi:MAG: hypothetical protein F6J93_36665 [Oscillatoria sp. SIO1A7]|nr:hypothetical protein [Oscillatoria sp. SIO1A7]
MSKLVILKLSNGDFDRGFTATLEIGEDGDRPSFPSMANCPRLPKLLKNTTSGKEFLAGRGFAWKPLPTLFVMFLIGSWLGRSQLASMIG